MGDQETGGEEGTLYPKPPEVPCDGPSGGMGAILGGVFCRRDAVSLVLGARSFFPAPIGFFLASVGFEVLFTRPDAFLMLCTVAGEMPTVLAILEAALPPISSC